MPRRRWRRPGAPLDGQLDDPARCTERPEFQISTRAGAWSSTSASAVLDDDGVRREQVRRRLLSSRSSRRAPGSDDGGRASGRAGRRGQDVRAHERLRPRASDRLELLERLAAARAVADRPARGRAEDVLELRLRRAAVGAAEDASTRSWTSFGALASRGAGGAKPAALSFSRPSGVIGRSTTSRPATTSTSGSAPSAAIASAICARITSSAGQPRNVGVNSTCTRSPSTRDVPHHAEVDERDRPGSPGPRPRPAPPRPRSRLPRRARDGAAHLRHLLPERLPAVRRARRARPARTAAELEARLELARAASRLDEAERVRPELVAAPACSAARRAGARATSRACMRW